MANTFTQLYIHVIFAVQNRTCLIQGELQEAMQKYITGTVQKLGSKMIEIRTMPDHTHMVIGQRPDIALSETVAKTKSGSSGHANKERWFPGRFSWQEGFGAFSVSPSKLKMVVKYVRNQDAHHRRETFMEEYARFLEKYQVPYDERYVFNPVL